VFGYLRRHGRASPTRKRKSRPSERSDHNQKDRQEQSAPNSLIGREETPIAFEDGKKMGYREGEDSGEFIGGAKVQGGRQAKEKKTSP